MPKGPQKKQGPASSLLDAPTQEETFAGLEAWQEIPGAHALPAHLRALTSPQPEERTQAQHALAAALSPNGAPSALVVPVLLRLLGAAALPERAWICRLLRQVAEAGAPRDPEAPVEPPAQEGRRAVLDGRERLLSLVAAPEASLRASVAYLLAALPELRAASQDALAAQFSSEAEPHAATSQLLALGALGDEHRDLVGRHLDDRRPLVRIGAALALSYNADHLLPPEAVRVLVDALLSPPTTREEYQLLPFARGDLLGDAARALSHADPHITPSLAPLLLAVLPSAASHGALAVAESLLAIAFPSPPQEHLPPRRYLSYLQQATLRAIASHGALPRDPLAALLARYRMPLDALGPFTGTQDAPASTEPRPEGVTVPLVF